MLDLPLDIQYRVISHLDWPSLPSAALTCKLWSDLVRRHVQSTDACKLQWSHALVRAKPDDVIKDDDTVSFVDSLLLATKYLEKLTAPGIVIVMATPDWEPYLRLILDALLQILPNAKHVHILCCVAVGIIGTDVSNTAHEVEFGEGFYEQEHDSGQVNYGLSLALLHVGYNQLVFSLACEKRRQQAMMGEQHGDRALERAHAHMMQVYRNSDASKATMERNVFAFCVGENVYDVNSLKTKIETKFNKVHLMGGLCGYDARKRSVFFSSPDTRAAERELNEGSSGGGGGKKTQKLKFSAAAIGICKMRTTSSSYRGLYPLTQEYRVMKVAQDEDGSKLYSLQQLESQEEGEQTPESGSGSGSAQVVVKQVAEVLGDIEAKYGNLHGVIFGVKRESTAPVDSLAQDSKPIRQVETVDIVRGVWDSSVLEAIIVPVELKGGEICSFYSYGAKESLKELDEILGTLKEGEAMPDDCAGGFLVICNARGSYLHKKHSVESSFINKALPNMPLVGFLANGEVGPVPYREWDPNQTKEDGVGTVIQGNTSVLTILRG